MSFQAETEHVRPAWLAGPGEQQMMMHLDIEVGDLTAAGAHAEAAGAVLADFQPQDDVRVYIDPAGIRSASGPGSGPGRDRTGAALALTD